MKNVTITLDEETARWARIEAAKRETSVSRLVGDLLQRYMAEAESYDDAMNQFLSRPPQPISSAGGPYPQRDELHERADLR